MSSTERIVKMPYEDWVRILFQVVAAREGMPRGGYAITCNLNINSLIMTMTIKDDDDPKS